MSVLHIILHLLTLTHSSDALTQQSHLTSRRFGPHNLPASSSKKKNHNDAATTEYYCETWRFSVETNNIGVFTTIPSRCENYIKTYMNEGHYASDADSAAENAHSFAKNVTITNKDGWVFDIDDTLLSNLPYYQRHHYGGEAYNSTAFDAWTALGIAPPIPANLRLYKQIHNLGFKIFLLTGRSESFRNVTVKNLLSAGYTNWERLILRGHADEGVKAEIYKSSKREQLVKEGYTIHGNCGDQWSDLLGNATAIRSFKVPNPMYYIP